MQRINDQPAFTDAAVADPGSPRALAFFEVCNREIPWADLAASVAGVFADRGPSAGRAPHWPLVTMLEVALLQRWFALPDPTAEEMLKDRIRFRRFVGLSFDDKTPGHSTICASRRRLLDHGHGATLFDRTPDVLRAKGLVMTGGTLVDATIIKAPRGFRRAGGSATADPRATKTCKGGRGYHGYRAHVAADRNGIVTGYVYSTAAESEHTHFDRLAAGEAAAVCADGGCRSKARVAALAAHGVAANLCRRRVRGQAGLSAEQRAFNRAVSEVRAFVEHPFARIKRMSGARAWYRWRRRNGLGFALAAVAYNFRRSFTVTPATVVAG